MTGIGTVAIITAKPEAADQVRAALVDLAAATQQEDGCLLYVLNRSLEEPHVFVTIEKWASQEALQQHLSSPHLQAAMAQAGELLGEAPRIIPLENQLAGDTSVHRY